MTWRGISRKLLLGSFLIVAMVWMFACTHRTRYISGTETLQRGITLRSGTLEFHSAPQPETGARLEPWFEFLRLPASDRFSWGHLSFTGTPVPRQADHSTGPLVPGRTTPPVAEDRRWLVQVPVWALWFPLAVFILAFCRIMEKRSGSGEEKAPAEVREEDDDVPSNPDASIPSKANHGGTESASSVLLTISAVLLLLAILTGGYWPLPVTSSAFAIWGLREARTQPQRSTGNVLMTITVIWVVFGYLVATTRRY